MSEALAGIVIMAVLFVIAGVFRLRSCNGHCAGCTRSCEHFQEGGRHAG